VLDLEAYFARIGFRGEAAADLPTLAALHRLHPARIAFENLDPLLGRTVDLDAAALQRKLVIAGRGGYCYEHNLLFHRVLAALGFRVSGLSARVLWNQPEDAVTSRTHMLLRVELAEGSFIADVGFGGLTLTAPLRLAPELEQTASSETFRIVPAGADLRLQVRLDAAWASLYRFDLTEQFQIDYEVMNHFQSTHPRSLFRNTLLAARTLPEARYALLGNRLTVHRPEGKQTRHLTAAELRAALQDEFAIRLPSGAELDALLVRLTEAT